jgi:indolepyruvate ferredoxin oxidoreductase alpha subunit
MKSLLSGNEAIARGAYEAGIQLAFGYPGTPSSEILENVANYREIYSEWSTNEKVAMDAAAGAAYSGRRCMITTKQSGMNVIPDSLYYAVYTGLEAGLVVVTADDPGMFSSQNEQDNRYYAKQGKLPILEPADSQEAKDFMGLAIEISERFDTPVIVRTTMRTSHSKSLVELGKPGRFRDEIGPFPRNPEKYNCMCAWSRVRHCVVEERLIEMARYAETMPANRLERYGKQLGIITSGVTYEYAKEVFPEASFLKLGMTFPLPAGMIKELAAGVDEVLVIEELDGFLEEQVKALGVKCRGKDIFPPCGELLPEDIAKLTAKAGIGSFTAPQIAPEFNGPVPSRSPVLCPGCPHRASYFFLSKMKVPVAGDIGCYNLGALPPYSAQHTMGAMGASIGVLHGMSKAGLPEKGFATIGDSTFFHAGIPPLMNMIHNKSKGSVIIMDNGTTAMTGHQDHPGVGYTLSQGQTHKIDIGGLCRAIGVPLILKVNPFDMEALETAFKTCLDYDGLSVLIAEGPCVFVSRSSGPPMRIDHEKCVACGICEKLGCPALVKSPELTSKGKATMAVDPVLCASCTMCAQICPQDAIS